MPNQNAHKLAQVKFNFKKKLPRAMNDISKIALDFFRYNFKKEGTHDQSFKSWKPRKVKFSGPRKQLLRDSGKLFTGLRRSNSRNRAVVFNKVKYANLHNDGGTVKVTPKMRRFFWAKHMEAKKAGKTQDADIWKSLALKKGDTITIPERPILYKSRALEKKFERYIDKFIKSL